jgi:hypothetical protein
MPAITAERPARTGVTHASGLGDGASVKRGGTARRTLGATHDRRIVARGAQRLRATQAVPAEPTARLWRDRARQAAGEIVATHGYQLVVEAPSPGRLADQPSLTAALHSIRGSRWVGERLMEGSGGGGGSSAVMIVNRLAIGAPCRGRRVFRRYTSR